jgi:hypothetical protein
MRSSSAFSEREVPDGKTIEAVVDNYATHKHAKVRAWLERHPRWTFYFTPTSGSWLNAVENFFSVLTRKRIRIVLGLANQGLAETAAQVEVELFLEAQIWLAILVRLSATFLHNSRSVSMVLRAVRLNRKFWARLSKE